MDAPNFAGSTPLHSAVNNKHTAMASLLVLEGGANSLCADELGDTPRDSSLSRDDAVTVQVSASPRRGKNPSDAVFLS